MNTIINSLRWRYATKKFDASKKLSQEQLETILEALRLSPSSFGLQPWKFVVVNDAKKRELLKVASWNQSQVTDASHFVVIAVPKVIDSSLVDNYIASMKNANVSADAAKLEGLSGVIKNFMNGKSADALKAWVRNQAYIALGVVLTVAAVEKIDACPMEGFNSSKFDAILGLSERGLESCVCLALGFRASDDAHAEEPKVRYSKEDVIIEIN